MPIQNLPPELQPAIQQGYLEREFQNGLRSVLAFRQIADRIAFPNSIGETFTKTRPGLKAPVTQPSIASENTGLDNGMTPKSYALEQYTLGIDQYNDGMDLNIVASGVAIKHFFLQNAYTNGVQAAQSLDRIARDTLFNAYLGGHTRTRVKSELAQDIKVDDIRGFEQVLVGGGNAPGGKMERVCEAHPAVIDIGSSRHTLVGVKRDEQNASTAPNGVSGTLILKNALHESIEAGTHVVHAHAPTLIRPNGREDTGTLQRTDVLTLGSILDAEAALRNNTGMTASTFKLFLDNQSMRQLFADPHFREVYRGQYQSDAYQTGRIVHLAGIDFVPTTEAYVQTLEKAVAPRQAQEPTGKHKTQNATPSASTARKETVTVRRSILVAPGALIEGAFSGMQAVLKQNVGDTGEIHFVDGVAQVTRAPLDRLQQWISQSWFWIGGFCAPSDATADQRIIPTANNAYYKRAVVIEHAG